MAIKPILFNTEMVRAILMDGRAALGVYAKMQMSIPYRIWIFTMLTGGLMQYITLLIRSRWNS